MRYDDPSPTEVVDRESKPVGGVVGVLPAAVSITREEPLDSGAEGGLVAVPRSDDLTQAVIADDTIRPKGPRPSERPLVRCCSRRGAFIVFGAAWERDHPLTGLVQRIAIVIGWTWLAAICVHLAG